MPPESLRFEESWQALVVCPDQGMATELSGVLASGAPSLRVSSSRGYPTPAEAAALMGDIPLNVCFLDMESDRQKAFELLEKLLQGPDRLPVVALLSDNSPESILRCLRRGAAGFLLRPFTAEQLVPLLRRTADLYPTAQKTPSKSGKVYAVIPAKGSSGATTIASNLAWQCKQLGASRVLLADMDPLTSTLSFLLKLQSQYSLADALSHIGHLDVDLWKALVTGYRGVDVLTSPESPLDGGVEGQDPRAIVEFCRSIYELVFLDAGGPYGAWNARLARLSDQVLLVVTAELPTVYAAQRAMGYLSQNGVPKSKLRLLVNRNGREAGLGQEDIESALGVEVYQLLPNDRDAVHNALLEGRPAPPGSQFGKSVAELAARLSEREAPLKKSPQAGGLLSLFSRVTS